MGEPSRGSTGVAAPGLVPSRWPRMRSVFITHYSLLRQFSGDVTPFLRRDRSDRQPVSALEERHLGQAAVPTQLGQADELRLGREPDVDLDPPRRCRGCLRIVILACRVELGCILIRRTRHLGDPRDPGLWTARMIEE